MLSRFKVSNFVAFWALGMVSSQAMAQFPQIFMVNEDPKSPSFSNITVWSMRGERFNRAAPLDFLLPRESTCVAVADFNNDGWTDTLWFYPESRTLEISFVESGRVTGTEVVSRVREGYELVGPSTFGTRSMHLLMRNVRSNQLIRWYLSLGKFDYEEVDDQRVNVRASVVTKVCYLADSVFTGQMAREGTSPTRTIKLGDGKTLSLPPVPRNYEWIGAGDYNEDGVPDLVWVNKKGKNQMFIWLMDESYKRYESVRVRATNTYNVVGLGFFR